ncbi:hypothetical protein [Lentilactobacillus parabuchneri]
MVGAGQQQFSKMVLIKNVSVSFGKPVMGNDHYFVEYGNTR